MPSPASVSTRVISWLEPNRANTAPLHIARRGERYSTVTGAAWLNEHLLVANHRNGMKLALFDVRQGERPVVAVDLPCLSDDVALKCVGEHAYEVAVSGCWDCVGVVFSLHVSGAPTFHRLGVIAHQEHSFSHGVAYDPAGMPWFTLHTGAAPRIANHSKAWRLPEPWGARDVCFDEVSGRPHVVAVTNNPRQTAYENTATSVWRLNDDGVWHMVWMQEQMHADACCFYKGVLWVPDQLNDRVLGVDLAGVHPTKVLTAPSLNFPHGLSISSAGTLAVTNYGGSSITLFDLLEIPVDVT